MAEFVSKIEPRAAEYTIKITEEEAKTLLFLSDFVNDGEASIRRRGETLFFEDSVINNLCAISKALESAPGYTDYDDYLV